MTKIGFEYVTPEYISNCMIEAVKAKLKDPRHVKLYFCKPRITENEHFQMFHFMWSDGEADYDFSDSGHGKTPWYKCLLFKGQIRRFKLGFAARYCATRKQKTRYREMKIFISIPQRGRPDSEVDAERTAIFQRIRKVYETEETPECFPVELIDQFYTGHEEDIPVEGDRLGVFYLGVSLQHLMYADAACFANGWDTARGCRIEHAVCREYNIPILDLAELEGHRDALTRKRWTLNECGVDMGRREEETT